MKCLWKKVICGALVAGMLAQCPQSIYAEDAANTATVTDTESNHVTPDTTQQRMIQTAGRYAAAG